MNEKSVSSYIAGAPKWAQPILRELRKTVRAAAPEAKESISYHMPYYNQNGRLAYFAAQKKHVGFYWISEKDKKVFAKELKVEKVVGNSLHIFPDQKVPATLIKKIIKARIKSNKDQK